MSLTTVIVLNAVLDLAALAALTSVMRVPFRLRHVSRAARPVLTEAPVLRRAA